MRHIFPAAVAVGTLKAMIHVTGWLFQTISTLNRNYTTGTFIILMAAGEKKKQKWTEVAKLN